MEIRTARLSDRQAIAELMTALDYPGTEAFLTQRMCQLLAHPDEALLVALEGERVHAFYRREGFVEAPKYFAKLLNQ